MNFNLDLKRERKTGVSDFERQRKHGSWMSADFFCSVLHLPLCWAVGAFGGGRVLRSQSLVPVLSFVVAMAVFFSDPAFSEQLSGQCGAAADL